MSQPAAGGLQVEQVLDELIERLTRVEKPSAPMRAALIEARRLRNFTARWSAIPPPDDARREMLTRVMDLVAETSGRKASQSMPSVSGAHRAVRRALPSERPAQGSAFEAELDFELAPPAVTAGSPAREIPFTPADATPVADVAALAERAGLAASEKPPPPPKAPTFGKPPGSGDSGERPAFGAADETPLVAPPDDLRRAGRGSEPDGESPALDLGSIPPPPPLANGETASNAKGRPKPPPRPKHKADASGSVPPPPAWLEEDNGPLPGTPLRSSVPAPPAPSSGKAKASRRPPPLPTGRPSSPELGDRRSDSGRPSDPGRRSDPGRIAEPSRTSDPGRRSDPADSRRPPPPRTSSQPALRAARASSPAIRQSNPAMPVRTPTGPAPGGRTLRAPIAPGITLVRPDAAPWRPFPKVPGATIKLLFRNPQQGAFTALLQLEAGAALPRHKHASVEEMFIIDGVATIGEVELCAGDYCRAEPQSVHERIESAVGCTILLNGSERDEILDDE